MQYLKMYFGINLTLFIEISLSPKIFHRIKFHWRLNYLSFISHCVHTKRNKIHLIQLTWMVVLLYLIPRLSYALIHFFLFERLCKMGKFSALIKIRVSLMCPTLNLALKRKTLQLGNNIMLRNAGWLKEVNKVIWQTRHTTRIKHLIKT